jgi:hypothetical protein
MMGIYNIPYLFGIAEMVKNDEFDDDDDDDYFGEEEKW